MDERYPLSPGCVGRLLIMQEVEPAEGKYIRASAMIHIRRCPGCQARLAGLKRYN